MLAGIAVRRLVEGIGELPFLRLVAPLRRGVADNVVGTEAAQTGVERAARFVTFRSIGCGRSGVSRSWGTRSWGISNGLISLASRNIGPLHPSASSGIRYFQN